MHYLGHGIHHTALVVILGLKHFWGSFPGVRPKTTSEFDVPLTVPEGMDVV